MFAAAVKLGIGVDSGARHVSESACAFLSVTGLMSTSENTKMPDRSDLDDLLAFADRMLRRQARP